MSLYTYTTPAPISIAAEAVVVTWANDTGRDVLVAVPILATGLSAATSKPTFIARSLTSADVVIGDSDTFTQSRSAVSDGVGYRSNSRPLGPILVAAGAKLQVRMVGLAGDITVTVSVEIIDAQETVLATAQPNYAPALAGDAMAMTAAERQEVSRIMRGGDYVFVPHDGNDLTSGATLRAAVEAATAGDTVLVGAGTFDLNAARITIPVGVTVEGMGQRITAIRSQCDNTNPIIIPLANTAIRRVTIETYGVAEACYGAIGDSYAPLFCVIEDCELLAQSATGIDGIIFLLDATPAVCIVRRVLARSRYDCFNAVIPAPGMDFSAFTAIIEDCDFESDAAGMSVPYGPARAVSAYGGRVIVRGGRYVARNGTYVVGVGYDRVGAGSDPTYPPTFDVSGTYIHAENGSIHARDLSLDGPTLITIGGSIYDPATVGGDGSPTLLPLPGIQVDATNTRAVVGLAAADLDTQLAGIQTSADGAQSASQASATSAASADGKLTAVRLALIDGARQQTQATTDKADLLAAIQTPGSGDGDTPVNHDTGGADNLRLVDGAGQGIDNAAIRAYLASEYAADPTAAVCRATSVTGADGRWVSVMMLNSGLAHTIVFSRPGYNAITSEVTP